MFIVLSHIGPLLLLLQAKKRVQPGQLHAFEE